MGRVTHNTRKKKASKPSSKRSATQTTQNSGSNSSLEPVERTLPLNYQIYEFDDAHSLLDPAEYRFLKEQQDILQIKPYHESNPKIGATVYKVPYNGEKYKPTLSDVTGKKHVDFYSYSFYFNGKKWSIELDYHTGMVRTWSIFRCLKDDKTIPSNAVNENPGLSSLTPNLTGGNIHVQGFWMPYEPAKAICSRFAHPFRAALYPIFGPDVLRAAPQEGFKINPAVVARARADLVAVRGVEMVDSPMEDASEQSSDGAHPESSRGGAASEAERWSVGDELRARVAFAPKGDVRIVPGEFLPDLQRQQRRNWVRQGSGFGMEILARADEERHAAVGLMLLSQKFVINSDLL